MGTLPSGLDTIVGDDEYLARFLTSSSQFNSVGVKPSAFLPNPKDRASSVFRHGASPRSSLLKIGKTLVAGERKLHGVAICKAHHIRAALLDVVAQEPPPKHANIIGWPWLISDPELEKAQQKERAALVAQYAEMLIL